MKCNVYCLKSFALVLVACADDVCVISWVVLWVWVRRMGGGSCKYYLGTGCGEGVVRGAAW